MKEWWKKEHTEPRLREKGFQKQRRNDRPRPLPKKRKRTLSLPLNAESRLKILPSWKGKGTRDGKQKGACLTELPFDIRFMIWELVIPQRNISIFHGKRRLVHTLHQEGALETGKKIVFENEKQDNHLLDLMKTCRLM